MVFDLGFVIDDLVSGVSGGLERLFKTVHGLGVDCECAVCDVYMWLDGALSRR